MTDEPDCLSFQAYSHDRMLDGNRAATSKRSYGMSATVRNMMFTPKKVTIKLKRLKKSIKDAKTEVETEGQST